MRTAIPLGICLGASIASAQTPVPMKDVEIQATLHPVSREVNAVIRVAVSTPVGRIPVSGHGRLKYSCDGLFRGSMSYNPIVRFFAKLKGVALVTALDGKMVTTEPIDCNASLTRTLVGRADVDSTLMKGWIKLGSDSTTFSGPAWTFADSTYHSILSAHRTERPLMLHINMYKHPRMMKAPGK